MKYSEFVKIVECGMEPNFYFNDYEYWISNNSDGYYLTKCEPQNFLNADDFFINARVDGKTIQDLWHVIKEQLKCYSNYDEFVSKVNRGTQHHFEFEGCIYMIQNNQFKVNLFGTTPCKAFSFVKSITQDFKTVDELFRDGRIEGKSILELWERLYEENQNGFG